VVFKQTTFYRLLVEGIDMWLHSTKVISY